MNNIWIIIVMIVASAFFSGMEIAFLASNKLRLELDKKQGLFSSKIIDVFQSNPSQYIATILLGNNFAIVIYGIFMARSLNPFIESFVHSETGILAVQTIISTIIVLTLAEFLPKALVRANPNTALRVMAIPLFMVYMIFYPASRFLQWLSELFLQKRFRDNREESYGKLVFGTVDLDHLIQESQDSSETTEEEGKSEIKLFQNALDFSNVKVRDCMIPRPEIAALDMNASIDELRQRFVETGYSKILIYDDHIDNIKGYITSKELFKNPASVKSGLIGIDYVPETMSASKLLKKFIQEHKGVSVVVDEFGGVSGMLTIEDIIEEIFGEIDDEHDVDEFIEKKVDENHYMFSGRLEIDYLNEKYKLGIPDAEEYGTLAGYIIFHYGSIPKMNDKILIDKFSFKILKVSRTRVELVQLEIHEE